MKDQCARKHVCGNLYGMKGNYAQITEGYALFQFLPVAQARGHYLGK